jgi:hypothetical protein
MRSPTVFFVVSFIALLILFSGCIGDSFDASQVCEKVPGISNTPVGQTLTGSICSQTLKKEFSSEQIQVIQKSNYAGIVSDNAVVDFSCLVTNSFFGQKYEIQYLTSSSCDTQNCLDSPNMENGPSARCGKTQNSVSLCDSCNDHDPCTIDSCQNNGSTQCVFLPRCVQGTCNKGNCEQGNPCGNGICESSEDSFSCPVDCKAKTSCPGSGFTGADVSPRNKFVWSFSGIAPNECDNSFSGHSNCDMTQFLIAFLQKMRLTEEYLNQNTLTNQKSIEKVGTLTPKENGFDTEFEAAFLSDNLSYQLLWDFGHKESGFFDEPSWFKQEWKNYLMTNPSESPISIHYESPPINAFNAVHEAGIYHVKIETRFKTTNHSFFTGSNDSVQPNATITIVLSRTSNLPDATVLDLAFNGNIGLNNALRDYGVRFSQNQDQVPFTIIESQGIPGLTSFDSTNYRYGLRFVGLPNEETIQDLSIPAFYYPPASLASISEPAYFNEVPIVLQTIETNTRLVDGSKDQESFMAFRALSAVPLVSLNSAQNNLDLGAKGIPENLFALGAWIPIAQNSLTCEKEKQENPPETAANQCGEFPGTLSNGLLIPNSLSKPKLYFNIAFIPPSDGTQIQMLGLCNSGGEIGSPSSLASHSNEFIELSNPEFTINNLKELIDGIKNNKICVSSETTNSNDYSSLSSNQTTITNYFFNTQALLNQLQPRLNQYLKNQKIGTFSYCG